MSLRNILYLFTILALCQGTLYQNTQNKLQDTIEYRGAQIHAQQVDQKPSIQQLSIDKYDINQKEEYPEQQQIEDQYKQEKQNKGFLHRSHQQNSNKTNNLSKESGQQNKKGKGSTKMNKGKKNQQDNYSSKNNSMDQGQQYTKLSRQQNNHSNQKDNNMQPIDYQKDTPQYPTNYSH